MPKFDWPKYRAHKEVRAVRIVSVSPQVKVMVSGAIEPDGFSVICEGPTSAQNFDLHVDAKTFARGEPKHADYMILYRDGYLSWCPAKEFEDGYTRVHTMGQFMPANLSPEAVAEIIKAPDTPGKIIRVDGPLHEGAPELREARTATETVTRDRAIAASKEFVVRAIRCTKDARAMGESGFLASATDHLSAAIDYFGRAQQK